MISSDYWSMHVAKLICPLCESTVRVPNARPHTRLHCRNCHTPFHVTKAGRAAIGEAPDVVGHDLEELKEKLREFRDRIPLKPIAIAALAVLVTGVVGRYLLGSSS